MGRPSKCVLAFALLAASAGVSPAAEDGKPFLHTLIQDHMVLQRGREVPLWGWTAPGARVTVSLAGRQAEATAGKDGRWLATLGPLDAGGPHTLTVAGPQAVTVEDVLVGEVWFCSGQSNMVFNLGTVNDSKEEIARADHPTIRTITLNISNDDVGFEEPMDVVKLHGQAPRWEAMSPKTASRVSATAYFFARSLQERLQTPIGLIIGALNGSPIEAWMSRKTLLSLPEYNDGGALKIHWALKEFHWYEPCVRYNQVIHGSAPYGIRGFVWYQGETNAMWNRAMRYRRLLPLMIADWRACWGGEELPFIIVQLAAMGKTQGLGPLGEPWSELREAQLLATTKAPKTGLAVVFDVSDGDLHPRTKKEFGPRIALVARRLAYGEDIVAMGPVYRSMAVEGSAIRLVFGSLGDGLVSSDGQPLRWFTIAGEDRAFRPAEARIDGDTILVSSPEVAKPVAVRYAWVRGPHAPNLYNKARLPAPPFRTDDWNPHCRPAAAFTLQRSEGGAPVAVVLDSSGTHDPDHNIVRLDWDFGDGAAAAGPSPTHVYRKPGTYTLTLTARDSDGFADTAAVHVEVGPGTDGPKVPMVLLTRSVEGGPTPVAVAFDAGRSVDADGKIVSWAWDFGDGARGTGVAVRHVFQTPGRYTVTASATDDQGTTATAAVQVIAIGPGTGDGRILCERWRNIPGTDLDPLREHPAFPDKPDDTLELDAFDIPTNWADHYGARVRGYLHPPATGDYVFCIASDDSSELSLSTNESQAKARPIARVRGNAPRLSWADQGERLSKPIRLEGGRRYYIEALLKEGSGGDHMAVQWTGPGLPRSVIRGLYLSKPDAIAGQEQRK